MAGSPLVRGRLGGALYALKFQCAQRDSLSELFLLREHALYPVQGKVSERLCEALRGVTLRLARMKASTQCCGEPEEGPSQPGDVKTWLE